MLRTKEEDETFINNYEKTVLPNKVKELADKQTSDAIKEVHNRYDNDLFELTGERKNHDEKTYAFLKRKLTELKESSVHGKIDEVTKNKIAALEKELINKKDFIDPIEINKKVSFYENKMFSYKMDAALSKLNISIPATINDETLKQNFISSQTEMIKNDFSNKFKKSTDENGIDIYSIGDKPELDITTGKPLTELDLLRKYYGFYFISEVKAKGGMGSGSYKEINSIVESGLKTKADVTIYLTKKGLIAGGDDFMKEYQRIISEYAIIQ